jgi:hypothetical protein
MRRRRPESNNRADHRQAPSIGPGAPSSSEESSEPEYLDEDEQKEIVAEFEKELMEQVDLMNRVFSVVCRATMAASLLALVWEPTYMMLVHVIYGCAIFWLAQVHVVVKKDNRGMSFMLVLLLVLLPFHPLIYQTKAFGHLDIHWAIAGVNVILMMGAHILRMDTISHIRGLDELASSTYKYRSL